MTGTTRGRPDGSSRKRFPGLKALRPAGVAFTLLVGCLLIAPRHGAVTGQTTAPGGLPEGPITFRFEAYANNVRVLPPLIYRGQLGPATLRGSGTIQNGRVTGTFVDEDSLQTLGQTSLRATIVDGVYEEDADSRRLLLVVQIVSAYRPVEGCVPGQIGELALQDSRSPLPNGHPDDFVRLEWEGVCSPHVHGWNNTDPGPRTEPPVGGPPDGGQWADVEIGGGGPGPIGTIDEAHERLRGVPSSAALDLIIAFDLTGSMGPSIESLKRRTVDLVRRAQAKSPDFRLGLVTYRDAKAAEADREPDPPFWERPLGPISASDLESLMAGWQARGGGDDPEDLGEALSRSIAMWEREGETGRKPVKLVVVVTDAPGKWPDAFGNTHESISKRAFEVDPAHIYPIIVGGSDAALKDGARLAEMTGGGLLRAEDGEGVADAVLAAVDEGFRKHVGEVAPPAGVGGGGPVGRGGHGMGPVYVVMGILGLLAVAGLTLLVARRGGTAGRAGVAGSRGSGPPVELFLELTGSDGLDRRIDIDRTPTVLGRDPGCDIVIDDPAVSRRHAQVIVEDGELVLVDLGSAAGILADGRRETRVRLWRGRELRLGDTQVRVL